MISFRVPGIPQPGGSKRGFVTKAGRVAIVEDAKKNKPWRVSVQGAALAAHSGGPLSGPLALRVVFVMPRPKGHFGSGRNAHVVRASAPRFPASKPDTTKLLRSTEDALSGVLWADDAQIVTQHVTKRYAHVGEGPGAWVEVEEVC
jgi:Holliday junction resolvase RusA-like endonuclease